MRLIKIIFTVLTILIGLLGICYIIAELYHLVLNVLDMLNNSIKQSNADTFLYLIVLYTICIILVVLHIRYK